MLEAAVLLPAVGGRWEDFFVILAMLLINGGVSWWPRPLAGGQRPHDFHDAAYTAVANKRGGGTWTSSLER